MLCFSVDSPDSLENVETKWVGEIAENCPGVKLVLVALKCDLRKRDDDDAEGAEPEKPCIDYEEGLRIAEKIKALRYLGMEAPTLVCAYVLEANLNHRMLCHEEQGRQRGFHRGRARSPASQDKQGQEQWLHHPLNLAFILLFHSLWIYLSSLTLAHIPFTSWTYPAHQSAPATYIAQRHYSLLLLPLLVLIECGEASLGAIPISSRGCA
jgi:hypothetical protein